MQRDAKASTILRNDEPLRVVEGGAEKPRKPGRPKGYPKTGGRKPGVKNRISKDVKQSIIVDGRPLETLFAIARGNRMKAADPSDPTKKTFVYPSLSDRERAARTLLSKVVPDLRAQELSGPGGEALVPEDRSIDDYKVARKLVFLLGKGVAAGEITSPIPVAANNADKLGAAEFEEVAQQPVNGEQVVPSEAEKPAAPEPLEAEAPEPGTRQLGQQFVISSDVVIHYDGVENDGRTERWHVLKHGEIHSSYATLAAAHQRGLSLAGLPSRGQSE